MSDEITKALGDITRRVFAPTGRFFTIEDLAFKAWLRRHPGGDTLVWSGLSDEKKRPYRVFAEAAVAMTEVSRFGR